MDKREKILKTAIKLFVKQGFENTPTSQIAKEAGVATGTLFHHFKTKEDLINEAYLYTKKHAMDYFAENRVSPKTTKEKVREVWTLAIEWGFKHKLEREFMFRFSNSVYITKPTYKRGESIIEPVTLVFGEGIEKNVFKPLPPEVLVATYVGIFQGFLNGLNKSKKLDKKLVETGFEVLWDALKK